MAIMPMRSTAAAARTAASHGMDMRIVQPSPEMLESVAPPDVTIRSSASRSTAKSRASPQMRPVETATYTPASRARRTASVVVSATLFCGVSAVPSRSSAISLILFICLSPFSVCGAFCLPDRRPPQPGMCVRPDDIFPYYIRIPQRSINCKSCGARNRRLCKKWSIF